jgi:hypothetical protein
MRKKEVNIYICFFYKKTYMDLGILLDALKNQNYEIETDQFGKLPVMNRYGSDIDDPKHCLVYRIGITPVDEGPNSNLNPFLQLRTNYLDFKSFRDGERKATIGNLVLFESPSLGLFEEIDFLALRGTNPVMYRQFDLVLGGLTYIINLSEKESEFRPKRGRPYASIPSSEPYYELERAIESMAKLYRDWNSFIDFLAKKELEESRIDYFKKE